MVGARPLFRVRFGRGRAGWCWAPGAGVALVRGQVRWPAQSPVPQHPPPASLSVFSSGRLKAKARQKQKAKQGGVASFFVRMV